MRPRRGLISHGLRWDAHIPGYPVSASTYTNQKCRCSGCCRANTERCGDYQQRIDYAAQRRAKRRRGYQPHEVCPLDLGNPTDWIPPRATYRHGITDGFRRWFEDVRDEWD